MDYDVAGKHALVTGGATGIGFAVARRFLEEGVAVTVSGLKEDEVALACERLGERAQGLAGDLTRAGEAQKLCAFAERAAPVDFLVNCVGAFEVRDFFEISDERWFEYFDINVMTSVRMSRIVLAGMLERGTGSIVFVSSESGVKPQPWMAHYGAMKSCLLGLSRALAELTRGTRVTVNAILPGPTATEAVRNYHQEIAAERGISREEVVAEYFDQVEPTSLIRRMIEPEEVARSILHLACSPYLNGTAMRAEGGTIRAIL